ncbi:dual specificity protein phosphatase 3-like isoform X2 [Limulus polyphemus]|nr:dual specificity protein phosphatase 3-like isoform X2 [Limulus polyphemus]XP_022251294.1 dual specificity protein phosphatase 3-like isoform X2 [Limulus polyphemus]
MAMHPNYKECNNKTTTVTHLHHVILHTRPYPKVSCNVHTILPHSLGKHIPFGEHMTVTEDCDEVYPSIFIGNESTARNIAFLQQIGITHVVNTAEGTGIGQVNTGKSYYHSISVQYLGMNILDIPQARISSHFDEAGNFIDSALKNGGKVLIHCFMGISRSSTVAIAYLMLKKGMTAEEALHVLRSKRDVRPNEGFLQQLVELDSKLKCQC